NRYYCRLGAAAATTSTAAKQIVVEFPSLIIGQTNFGEAKASATGDGHERGAVVGNRDAVRVGIGIFERDRYIADCLRVVQINDQVGVIGCFQAGIKILEQIVHCIGGCANRQQRGNQQ